MMNTNQKKHLTLFSSIILALLVSLIFTVSASAESSYALDSIEGTYKWLGYENPDGTVTVTGDNGTSYFSTGEIVIPSVIGGKRVSAIGTNSDSDNFYVFDPKMVKRIVFPDTVIKINDEHDDLFAEFSNLQEVVFPNNPNCSIDWKYGNLFGETVNGRPVNKITSVSIHGQNTDGISYFTNLTNLTVYGADAKGSIDLHSFDETALDQLKSFTVLTNKADISLEGFKSLESISFPNGSGSIHYRKIKNCPNFNLTELNYYYNGSNYQQRFHSMDFENSRIQTVNLYISDADSFYRDIERSDLKAAFMGMKNLKAIHVKSAGISGVFDLDGVLYAKTIDDCGNYVGNTYQLLAYPAAKNPGGNYIIDVHTSKIVPAAFYQSTLSTVTIPEDVPWNFDMSDGMAITDENGNTDFYGIGDLSTVKFNVVEGFEALDSSIPSSRVSYYKSSKPDTPTQDDSDDDNNNQKITSFTAGKIKYKILSEKEVQVESLSGLKSKLTVSIPSTVSYSGKTYKVTAIHSAAAKELSKVTTLKIGKYLKKIPANTFKGLKKLKKADLSKAASLTSIGKTAFANCTALTTVSIGSKKLTIISAKAFSGDKKLKKITIRSTKLTKKGVKSALSGSGITTVVVPKTKVSAYKKIFTKGNCGKTVKVRE